MKAKKKVKIEISKYVFSDRWVVEFSIGNWTTKSEPFSSEADAKRGAKALFKSELPNREPLFPKPKP